MDEFGEIISNLRRIGAYAAKLGGAKKILLAGEAFVNRARLQALCRPRKLILRHTQSILPFYLRWLPIPTARFYIVEALDISMLEECFYELSEQGIFAIHIFDPALLPEAIDALKLKRDVGRIAPLEADRDRLSWIANMDDANSETGLSQEWIFGAGATTKLH
ncbi:MAG: hypothetical protein AB7S74_17885 [Hyphomicrobium sp.]